jgi:transcriptional regulator with XRE-family HTH domain
LPAHPEQGRTIKEARISEGWAQAKLAEAAGISQPFLCQLERGTRALSPRTARKLYAVLGVRVPLPPIDLAQTAAGRLEARQRDAERLRAEALRRRQNEDEWAPPLNHWSPLARRWARSYRSSYVMDARDLPPSHGR